MTPAVRCQRARRPTANTLAAAQKHSMRDDGAVPDAPGENWHAINVALALGVRGLKGGSSLPKLLAMERGVRNHKDQPALTHAKILKWARAHFARHSCWPTQKTGPMEGGRDGAAPRRARTQGTVVAVAVVDTVRDVKESVGAWRRKCIGLSDRSRLGISSRALEQTFRRDPRRASFDQVP